jgi:phage gpG-like protein
MITITLPNLDDVLAWVAALPDSLKAALFAKSQELAAALQDTVGEKLSGEVLQSRTGLLKDSIANETTENDNGVSSRVFVSGDVPYAAIQEYGGVTKAHIIEAVNGKALAFNMGGKQAFFRNIHHPGSVIPERSYLRSSLDDMSDDIAGGLGDAAASGIWNLES